MRVFITGASGWIGSAVVPELLENGHEVLGLARSDASAAAIIAAGAEAYRGSLDDPEGFRGGVERCDGVIHLGYNHDFAHMEEAAKTDRGVIEVIGSSPQEHRPAFPRRRWGARAHVRSRRDRERRARRRRSPADRQPPVDALPR